VGLGAERSPWEDYEWFDLDDVTDGPVEPYVLAALDSLRRDPVWLPGDSIRVLLVDLDNLRVEPARLRGRLLMAVALAEQADHAAFSGQGGSVRRALPHLGAFAGTAVAVGGGHNEADQVLLDEAEAIHADDVQFVVISNDNIFASLATRGPLIVLSPGADALSDRLAEAASRVIDLQVMESAVGI
jgi:hypothetical protein